MPRQRSISPAFFTNGDLYDLEVSTRLPIRVAFAGLWCAADREGRFPWKPRVLKLDVIPYDVVDFEAVLSALASAGFIARYVVDGQAFGCIPAFLSHQKPHPREAPSRIPPPSSSKQGLPKADLGHAEGSPKDSTSRSEHQAFGVSGLRTLKPSGIPEGTPSASLGLADLAPVAQLVTAANAAIDARFGCQAIPLSVTHPASTQTADALTEAGVPIAYAVGAIGEIGRRLKAKPKSLAYFRDAVLEAWGKDSGAVPSVRRFPTAGERREQAMREAIDGFAGEAA